MAEECKPEVEGHVLPVSIPVNRTEPMVVGLRGQVGRQERGEDPRDEGDGELLEEVDDAFLAGTQS